MVLDIQNLTTRFNTPEGVVLAVNNVSLQVGPGQCLGVVGESGSGKTQVFMSVMGLLAKNGKAEGAVYFEGRQILGLETAQLNKLRGVEFSMIFQDPMTSLNPYLKISRQMTEVLIEHRGTAEKEAVDKSIEMLNLVGIPEAEKRFTMYPHEFSGGMRQRAMIAMALLCEPKLLIADEPTTALDVTVQAQILELIAGLGKKMNMATVLITHDLGVIAGLSDRVAVMYGGRVVEEAAVIDLFKSPQHPYSKGLLESMPRLDTSSDVALHAIAGQPPDLQALPHGCSFEPRCAYAFERCRGEIPELRAVDDKRLKACHLEKIL